MNEGLDGDRKITIGYHTHKAESKRRKYEVVEIPASEADEKRLSRLSMTPGEAMATRDTGRGRYQLLVYPGAGAADISLAMDGTARFSIDHRTMRALGFKWRRRWCGK